MDVIRFVCCVPLLATALLLLLSPVTWETLRIDGYGIARGNPQVDVPINSVWISNGY